MTLRTITFDDSTHKLVPLEPTDEMLEGAFNSITAVDEHFHLGIEARLYSFMIEAAPEYQEPEQLCDDGGKCGAGGYCNNCAAPVVKENGKLRERLANQHAGIEQLKAENEVLRKQAERYEKVRKLNAHQFNELYWKNIHEGINFDFLVDELGKDE